MPATGQVSQALVKPADEADRMFVKQSRYTDGPILGTAAELEITGLVGEPLRHVSTARVVLADYELIQHDFPELRTRSLLEWMPRLAELDPGDLRCAICKVIDDWLIANAALVSGPQAMQERINSRIYTDGEVIGYRPPKYGRAAVVPITCGPLQEAGQRSNVSTMRGLLDIKGIGVGPGKVPARRLTANGLEYLGFALKDYLVQKMVDRIFEREAPTLWTVPLYAILDLGFDVLDGQFGTSAAGVHVRRAHRRLRYLGEGGAVYTRVALDIETILRKYGLTAANQRSRLEIASVGDSLVVHMAGQRLTALSPAQRGLCLQLLQGANRVVIDCVDVQIAHGASWPPSSAQMYDFGILRAESVFSNPVGHPLHLAPSDVSWPDRDSFIQPDPRLALSGEK